MRKILLITLLVFISSGFTVSKRIDVLIEKEVKSTFSISSYQKVNIQISTDINATLPQAIKDNLFKISNGNSHVGYYYIGHGFGKTDYFDFIVIFDKNLIVSKVKVLIYREDHGGEVGSKRWLGQFIGKSKNDELAYLKNVSAISGATISVKSMTNEMNKLLKTIKILHTKQLL